MQIVRKNFTLKLLSLALAILGWAYIRFANNPAIAAHFNQELTVPITAVNVPIGYAARYTESTATITFAWKRGAPSVSPQNVKAVLDLAGRGAGVYNVPVELVAPDVAVQSLSPASVTLTLERIGQRLVPVVVNYVGSREPGIVVSEDLLTPETVSVNGTSGPLSQVVEVRADVPMPSSPRTFDEMVRPIPVDASGREVEGLQIAPDLVRVHVDFVSAQSAT